MSIEELLRPAIVGILDQDGHVNRTGFFISPDGYILTCCHNLLEILDNHNLVKIKTYDDQEFMALFETDKSSCNREVDFAILRAEGDNRFTHLHLGREFKDNDKWVTLGYSFPHTYREIRNTGKVHSKVRRIDGEGYDIELLTNEEIREGVSGSPVFHYSTNMVIGVIKQQAGEREGFAVPTNDVLSIWPELEMINSLNSDNDANLVKESLKHMIQEDEYSSFLPLLERIDNYYISRPSYININRSLLYIITKLNNELLTLPRPDFNRHFEQVSMGLIPDQWNLKYLIDEKDYLALIEVAANLFEHNREKLTRLILGKALPIILVTMDREYAEKLNSGEAFNGYPDTLREDFNRMKNIHLNNLDNWQNSYSNSVTSWKPFPGYDINIDDLMQGVIDDANAHFDKIIIPIFIDVKSLNEPCNWPALQILRNKVCLIIIDVISLQHPYIQREFRKTALDAFPKTLIAKISPNQDILNFICELMIIIEHHYDLEFSRRKKLGPINPCISAVSRDVFMGWLENHFQSTRFYDLFFKGV